MNLHESEKIAGALEKANWSSVFQKEDADLIVFNTCCIRETAEKRILGHLGQLKKLKLKKPSLKVALCGCMTQQSGKAQEIVKKYPFVNIVLGTHNAHLVAEKLNELRSKKRIIEIVEETGLNDGVPAAPKHTGTLLAIKAAMAAANGGTPRPTSKGAASAAGVPNPAAPSINAQNIQAIIKT